MFFELFIDFEMVKNECDCFISDVFFWQNKYNILQNNYDNLNVDKKCFEDKFDSMQKIINYFEYNNQILILDKNRLIVELELVKCKMVDLLFELDDVKCDKDVLKMEYEII